MTDAPGDHETDDRACGALLGAMLGDALGMPYEGLATESIPDEVDLRAGRLPAGSYTDDTQMSTALGEALLDDPNLDDLDALGARFVRAFEPHRGYGAGTREVLRRIQQGVPALTASRASTPAGARRGDEPTGSFGNGAAMRVAPVAVRHRSCLDALRAVAARSAQVTHAHPVGIDAAVVQAAAVAAALLGVDPLAAARAAAATIELRDGLARVAVLLARAPVPPAVVATELGNDATGHRSVPAAIYAALASPDPAGALICAVRLGGDTDTIASMAGAIAGARDGAAALPPRWMNALENHGTGRDHIHQLAHDLDRLRAEECAQ